MTTIKTSLLCGAILGTVAFSLHAQQTRLAPQQARITDEAIHADLGSYERTQLRIKGLNDAGRPVRDYHLSKAQCWLDVSFHEYTRNDRSGFPQEALTESEKLINGMEQGVSPLPTDTPLVNRAARVREDLWQRLGAIHGTPGFVCAQQAVACGEVELVHAGNEFNQQQWRHSKSYIQIAEDLVSDAEALSRQCGAMPGPVQASNVLPADTVLTANILFEFDRTGARDIRAYSLQSLDREFGRLRDENLRLVAVELVGHADRLDGRGAAYNQRLSEDRALTVRELLLERGVDAARISSSYKGDTVQVQQCDGVTPRAALRECLIPNRRVEVKLIVERG